MSNKKKNYSEKPIENPNTEAEEFSSEKRDTIIIISEIALIILLVILIIFLVFGRKNDNGSSGNNNSGNNGSGGENPSVDGGGEAEDASGSRPSTRTKKIRSPQGGLFLIHILPPFPWKELHLYHRQSSCIISLVFARQIFNRR